MNFLRSSSKRWTSSSSSSKTSRKNGAPSTASSRKLLSARKGKRVQHRHHGAKKQQTIQIDLETGEQTIIQYDHSATVADIIEAVCASMLNDSSGGNNNSSETKNEPSKSSISSRSSSQETINGGDSTHQIQQATAAVPFTSYFALAPSLFFEKAPSRLFPPNALISEVDESVGYAPLALRLAFAQVSVPGELRFLARTYPSGIAYLFSQMFEVYYVHSLSQLKVDKGEYVMTDEDAITALGTLALRHYILAEKGPETTAIKEKHIQAFEKEFGFETCFPEEFVVKQKSKQLRKEVVKAMKQINDLSREETMVAFIQKVHAKFAEYLSLANFACTIEGRASTHVRISRENKQIEFYRLKTLGDFTTKSVVWVLPFHHVVTVTTCGGSDGLDTVRILHLEKSGVSKALDVQFEGYADAESFCTWLQGHMLACSLAPLAATSPAAPRGVSMSSLLSSQPSQVQHPFPRIMQTHEAQHLFNGAVRGVESISLEHMRIVAPAAEVNPGALTVVTLMRAGRFGTVHRGIWTPQKSHNAHQRRQDVLIYTLSPKKAASDDLESEFFAMALCMSDLLHPNLQRLLGYTEHVETPRLILECTTDGTLRDFFSEFSIDYDDDRNEQIASDAAPSTTRGSVDVNAVHDPTDPFSPAPASQSSREGNVQPDDAGETSDEFSQMAARHSGYGVGSRRASSTSLRRASEQGKKSIPFSRAVAMCWELASALSYISERGYVHARVVLDAILVTHTYSIKLGDFSSARCIDQIMIAELAGIPSPHIPPETTKFSVFSFSSDVYMYGLCSWQILSCGVDIPAPSTRRRDKGAILLPQPHGCSAELFDLICSCLPFESDERASIAHVCEGIYQRLLNLRQPSQAQSATSARTRPSTLSWKSALEDMGPGEVGSTPSSSQPVDLFGADPFEQASFSASWDCEVDVDRAQKVFVLEQCAHQTSNSFMEDESDTHPGDDGADEEASLHHDSDDSGARDRSASSSPQQGIQKDGPLRSSESQTAAVAEQAMPSSPANGSADEQDDAGDEATPKVPNPFGVASDASASKQAITMRSGSESTFLWQGLNELLAHMQDDASDSDVFGSEGSEGSESSEGESSASSSGEESDDEDGDDYASGDDGVGVEETFQGEEEEKEKEEQDENIVACADGVNEKEDEKEDEDEEDEEYESDHNLVGGTLASIPEVIDDHDGNTHAKSEVDDGAVHKEYLDAKSFATPGTLLLEDEASGCSDDDDALEEYEQQHHDDGDDDDDVLVASSAHGSLEDDEGSVSETDDDLGVKEDIMRVGADDPQVLKMPVSDLQQLCSESVVDSLATNPDTTDQDKAGDEIHDDEDEEDDEEDKDEEDEDDDEEDKDEEDEDDDEEDDDEEDDVTCGVPAQSGGESDDEYADYDCNEVQSSIAELDGQKGSEDTDISEQKGVEERVVQASMVDSEIAITSEDAHHGPSTPEEGVCDNAEAKDTHQQHEPAESVDNGAPEGTAQNVVAVLAEESSDGQDHGLGDVEDSPRVGTSSTGNGAATGSSVLMQATDSTRGVQKKGDAAVRSPPHRIDRQAEVARMKQQKRENSVRQKRNEYAQTIAPPRVKRGSSSRTTAKTKLEGPVSITGVKAADKTNQSRGQKGAQQPRPRATISKASSLSGTGNASKDKRSGKKVGLKVVSSMAPQKATRATVVLKSKPSTSSSSATRPGSHRRNLVHKRGVAVAYGVESDGSESCASLDNAALSSGQRRLASDAKTKRHQKRHRQDQLHSPRQDSRRHHGKKHTDSADARKPAEKKGLQKSRDKAPSWSNAKAKVSTWRKKTPRTREHLVARDSVQPLQEQQGAPSSSDSLRGSESAKHAGVMTKPGRPKAAGKSQRRGSAKKSLQRRRGDSQSKSASASFELREFSTLLGTFHRSIVALQARSKLATKIACLPQLKAITTVYARLKSVAKMRLRNGGLSRLTATDVLMRVRSLAETFNALLMSLRPGDSDGRDSDGKEASWRMDIGEACQLILAQTAQIDSIVASHDPSRQHVPS